MTKVALNGFGRIGRAVFKNIIKNYPDLELVAVNDLADPDELLHLLRYDTVYGKYKVEKSDDCFLVDGQEIKIFNKENPGELPWDELKVDVVLECTGAFRTAEGSKKHIEAGAEKVIISAPAKSSDIPSYVMGVNVDEYRGEKIVDMGSCTTNALAPVVKILNKNFGIEEGLMTTIHSYTVSQNILDGPGRKDLRRCRAAAENIVPTTTGAAKAISKVIPEMEGKLDGMAVRVPTPTVSVVDLVCKLNCKATENKINRAFEEESRKESMQGIFTVEERPLVSSDYVKNSHSSIVDLEMTKVVGESVKVISWYDNEWGYARRLVDFAKHVGSFEK